MITDIIQELSAKMVNGVHHSWTGQGGTNFTYNIKFNSGKSGEFSSKSSNSPFQIHEKVEISKETPSDKFATKFSLKKFTEEGARPGNGGGSKSTYNDPKTVRDIAGGMAMAIARLHFKVSNINPQSEDPYVDFETLCKYYYDWIINGISEGDPGYRDQISRRYYTLQLAVECVELPVFNIKKSKEVIAAAEKLLVIHKNITDATS